ncbi:DUF3955 domain-containing protein [Enterobacter quasihormaechei]|nr:MULTISPECIES: DUF3955 domain-containing protein [Enterobacter]MEA3784809.1 DUF3955 domain-containing protein [Enterobacter quasihormaechei]MEA3871274.1 DUF3955 domain-containing protein [Enterobacter quasihormaechei]
MPRRRLLWIVLFVLSIASLLLGDASSYIDDNGVLQDSILMPLGALVAVLAIAVLVFDALLSLKQKIQ